MKWINIKRISGSLYNFWKFRKEIYNFQPWDYRYNLALARKSLEFTADYIEEKDRYVDAQKNAKDIREFIRCTDNKEFFDVSEEYNTYITSLNFKKIKDKPGHYHLISDKFTEERGDTLSKRAIKWEKARWNRAYKLIKNLHSWWD